jgi:hypothetical protein
MMRKHRVSYPAEGPNGPWDCNSDGSNPNCANCEPDAWKSETVAVPIGLLQTLLGYTDDYRAHEWAMGNDTPLADEAFDAATVLLKATVAASVKRKEMSA